jgi:hypothetical protein
MDETFTTTQDGRSSFRALKNLRDFRLVPKEKWKEWNKIKIQRGGIFRGSDEERKHFRSTDHEGND